MTKINEAGNTQPKIVSLQKYRREKQKREIPDTVQQEAQNLDNMPHYKIVPSKHPIIEAQKTLEHFHSDFGEVKSPTYIAQIIKKRSQEGADDEEISDLMLKRHEYHIGLSKIRSEMNQYGYMNNAVYCILLTSFMAKYGTYLNCGECSSLIKNMLDKKGVEAHNVYMTTQNEQGERVNKAEHVFTVINMKEDAKINDPSTWGDDAVVCDVWANIAMGKDEAIEYYRDLFSIDDRYVLHFEYSDNFWD